MTADNPQARLVLRRYELIPNFRLGTFYTSLSNQKPYSYILYRALYILDGDGIDFLFSSAGKKQPSGLHRGMLLVYSTELANLLFTLCKDESCLDYNCTYILIIP